MTGYSGLVKELLKQRKNIKELLIELFPGEKGEELRRENLEKTCKRSGSNAMIAQYVKILFPSGFEYGDNLVLNNGVWINAIGGVTIGNNVLIAPNVIIHSANHNYQKKDMLIKDQGHTYKKVIIEDDVWIGAGSIILPGSIIRKGTVIGAGSIITKETNGYDVVVGVSAKTKKYRV